MNDTFLTPLQAAQTDEYLRTIARRHATPAAGLQSLFGRCCLVTVPGFEGPGGVGAERVRADVSAYCASVVEDPRADQLGLDPLLVVEAQWMLEGLDFRLPALKQMTDRIAKELAAQPESVLSLGRVRAVAARLRDLGYSVKGVGPNRAAAELRKEPSAWLTASAAALGDLVEHMMADGARLDATESQILSLIALAELRNYRVDVGSKVLRLVLRHGEVEQDTTEALNYVAVQRRRDGGYGFANPFREQTPEAATPDLTLHLPMTLNAVWLFHTARTGAQKAVLAAGVE